MLEAVFYRLASLSRTVLEQRDKNVINSRTTQLILVDELVRQLSIKTKLIKDFRQRTKKLATMRSEFFIAIITRLDFFSFPTKERKK